MARPILVGLRVLTRSLCFSTTLEQNTPVSLPDSRPRSFNNASMKTLYAGYDPEHLKPFYRTAGRLGVVAAWDEFARHFTEAAKDLTRIQVRCGRGQKQELCYVLMLVLESVDCRWVDICDHFDLRIPGKTASNNAREFRDKRIESQRYRQLQELRDHLRSMDRDI